MTYQNNTNSKFKVIMFILWYIFYDKMRDIFFNVKLRTSKVRMWMLDFLLENFWEILLLLILVIPPILCNIFDWEIPTVYIIYAVIMGFKYFFMMLGAVDDGHSGYNNYNNNHWNTGSTGSTYTKPVTNPYKFEANGNEKFRNGGLTDKEVMDRKKLIRKKLS